jgi:hypothetical protein
MRMAHIYSHATRVLAWLREGEEDGFETFGWIASKVGFDFNKYKITARSDRTEDHHVSTGPV